MRKTLGAALVGLTALGGAAIAGAASAQPYGYYYNPPPTTYYYTPPPATYVVPAEPAPYYTAPGLAGAVIGSVLGADAFATVPGVRVDEYGPDPNGLMAADGRRIKCKLETGWDGYVGRYRTHRECWEEY